ncbi:hypothetical protein ACTMTI_52755 [Nonomuraea sp. H19]|uniref:hypothetical protein n=1 Tax=Nonomuraea sp. H19 TaxID=3452206 RepID=UPI003F88A438
MERPHIARGRPEPPNRSATYGCICVILRLRDGLRTGDVFVPLRRPGHHLYTPEQRAPRRSEYCRLAGKPPSAAEALEQGKEELHAALEERTAD